jgi:hypothetical protein
MQYAGYPRSARRGANRASPVVFAAIIASASVLSLMIGFAPYLFVSHDPKALDLSASLSNSTVLLNQTIKVAVSETNDLRLPTELPLSADWAVQNLTLAPCASTDQYPFGVAILEGRYTLTNLSSAKSLQLYPDDAFYSCPQISRAAGDSIEFSPHQDIRLSLAYSGYYTDGGGPAAGNSDGSTTAVDVLHSFASGTYTVAVGDEWGHTDLLYFQVSRIGLNTIVLCSPDCNYPAPYLSGTVYLNSTSPLRSLQVFINGTSEGVRTYNARLDSIDISTEYESSFQSPRVVSHGTYSVLFVVTFEDNATFSATTEVIAG